MITNTITNTTIDEMIDTLINSNNITVKHFVDGRLGAQNNYNECTLIFDNLLVFTRKGVGNCNIIVDADEQVDVITNTIEIAVPNCVHKTTTTKFKLKNNIEIDVVNEKSHEY